MQSSCHLQTDLKQGQMAITQSHPAISLHVSIKLALACNLFPINCDNSQICSLFQIFCRLHQKCSTGTRGKLVTCESHRINHNSLRYRLGQIQVGQIYNFHIYKQNRQVVHLINDQHATKTRANRTPSKNLVL